MPNKESTIILSIKIKNTSKEIANKYNRYERISKECIAPPMDAKYSKCSECTKHRKPYDIRSKNKMPSVID